jgi:hypothetical protein
MKLKDLYLHLGNYLLSIETQNALGVLSLPPIRHVDLWKEQPENEKTETAYSLPAVFIEFENRHYIDFGVDNESESKLYINFHLESHTWGATALSSPTQNTTLIPLELFDALQDILTSYRTTQGERLFIESSHFGREGASNPVSELTYTLKVYNCA